MGLEKKKFFVELSKNCILENCPSALVPSCTAVHVRILVRARCSKRESKYAQHQKVGRYVLGDFSKVGRCNLPT